MVSLTMILCYDKKAYRVVMAYCREQMEMSF